MDYTIYDRDPASETAISLAAADLTFSDAFRLLDTWTDLTKPQRATFRSVLKQIAGFAGVDMKVLALDCRTINAFLFRKPPAALEKTPQAFGNLVTGLRRIMRRLDLHAAEPTGRDGLTPAWQDLFDRLTAYRRLGLIGFMGFCSSIRIDPEAVDADVLVSFEEFCGSRILCPDPAGRARRTASGWNWAAREVAGWPQVHLTRPGMRAFYTIPLTEFPASFQADVEAFLRAMQGNHLDMALPLQVDPAARRRKRRKVTSPRTVDTRRWQIRQLAASFVLTGGRREDLTGLRDLVSPTERARELVDFYFERAGREPNSQVAGIIEVARQIARFHCKLPADVVELFGVWASNARPDNDQMTEKNRTRLLALITERRRAMLLGLPAELMKRANSPGLTPKAAARLVAYAVALEILLVFPMRRSNLASLRITNGIHLQRLDVGGKRITHICLSAGETKNGIAINWPIPPETAAMIELYLRKHRPQLAAPGNIYLFPGPGLAQRSAHELAIGLCKLIHETVGVEVNCHLLRHFAAWLFLKAQPGQYEIVRQVLGHKQLSTTVKFYSGLETDSSARHFDETMRRERAATRLVAKAAFGKGRRGGKKDNKDNKDKKDKKDQNDTKERQDGHAGEVT